MLSNKALLTRNLMWMKSITLCIAWSVTSEGDGITMTTMRYMQTIVFVEERSDWPVFMNDEVVKKINRKNANIKQV